jgi:hypothetical protein
MVLESDSEAMWTVRCRLKPDDLLTMQRLDRGLRYRRAPVYVAILFMFCGGGIGWLISEAADCSRPLAVTIGAGLGLLIFWALLRNAERRVIEAAERGGFFTEQVLTFGPDGIEQAFEDGRKVFRPWRTVRKLGKAHGNLVCIVDQNDTALLVPVRSFESEARADLVLMMARAWQANATDPDAPER